MAVREALLKTSGDVVFGWDQPSIARDAVAVQKRAADTLAASSPSLARRADAANASVLKRAIDFTGAAVGVILLLPLILMVAILIKLDTPGPVFFRQERYGQGRKPFFIFKFRSMTVAESTGAFRQCSLGDARVTRVGRMLRSTSLDELPQLFNVLKGEMSLVGPRPHAIAMDDAYGAVVECYSDRHLVRPGLTGLAQIEGYRGPTAEDAQITGRLRLDRAYIRKWSVLRDINILVFTPFRLFCKTAF